MHLCGFPKDVFAMKELAHAHGAALIEDSTQGAGGRLNGQLAGSMGDLGKGTTGGRGGDLGTCKRNAALLRKARG